MKSILLLAGAFALTTSAALAQTVVPGSTVPVPVTSGQTNAPIAPIVAPTGGSPRDPSRVEKVPNMDRRDRKMMRKMSRVKPHSRGGQKDVKNR